MLRSLLLDIAARTKADGIIDAAIRRNPMLRAPVEKALEVFKNSPDAFLSEAAQLEKRILHAALRTPYGKKKPLRLNEWPLLQKAQVVAHPRHFVCPGSVIRIPAGTGGTSGVPLELWRSLESIVAEQTFLNYLIQPFGLSMPGSRIAVLRADPVKKTDDLNPPYGKLLHGGKKLILSSAHLNRDTLGWYHQALTEFEPDILWVYPSCIMNLITLLSHAKLSLKVPVVLASSETLAPHLHQLTQDTFGGIVINYYGQAERVCFAYSTIPGVFHFHPCYGMVELLPVEENTQQNVKGYTIVGTSYWNRTMPLVRYNTGDLVYLPEQTTTEDITSICNGTRSFPAIAGRDNEYLLMEDGRRIIGLNHIPREVRNVSQVQLVQHDYRTLHIDVLTLPGFSEKDAKQLIDQTRAKIPPTLQAELRQVDKLRTTARGKTPFVIRLMAS